MFEKKDVSRGARFTIAGLLKNFFLVIFLIVGIVVVMEVIDETVAVLYDPFGGIYISATDCEKRYTVNGLGMSTHYDDSFVRVVGANWYRDDVEQVADGLWRIGGTLYDAAYLGFVEYDIPRTHRFVNTVDEATFEQIDNRTFRDADQYYVLPGASGWKFGFNSNESTCESFDIPTASWVEPVKSDTEKVFDSLIYLLELDTPPSKLENVEDLNGRTINEYKIVNGELYYHQRLQKPVRIEGVVVKDVAREMYVFDSSRDSLYAFGDQMLYKGTKIEGEVSQFSTIDTPRGLSKEFVRIGDVIYFLQQKSKGGEYEFVPTRADAESFGYASALRYLDADNYYDIGDDGLIITPR